MSQPSSPKFAECLARLDQMVLNAEEALEHAHKTREQQRAILIANPELAEAPTVDTGHLCSITNCGRDAFYLTPLRICGTHATAIWHAVEQSRAPVEPNPIPPPPESGHIYFVKIGDLVKVGWSSRLIERLKQYGASAEVLVHYPATRSDEALLHQQLEPSRAKGAEWYRDDPILRAFLNRALEEHGPPTVIPKWRTPRTKPLNSKWASNATLV